MSKFAAVIVFMACFCSGTCKRVSFDNGNFNASWTYNRVTDQLYFEVVVKARGWVAFGFTSTPKGMRNYDVIIGGQTEEGKSYLNDFITFDYGIPRLDTKQSYILDRATELNGITSLRYHRPRNTSDTQDFQFNDTTRAVLVWAYQGADDASNPNMFSMHTRRDHSAESFLILSMDSEPSIQSTTAISSELTRDSTEESKISYSQPTKARTDEVIGKAKGKSSGVRWAANFVKIYAVTSLCLLRHLGH
ncbi:uncharacterized protein [Montipora capricornis]|uniref:uncharacterized protein n=1 Tax=Montipora capricornis TaxID=246305 RepID=UPI0035F1AD28